MCSRRWIAFAILCAASARAQSPPAPAAAPANVAAKRDSFPALQARYAAEIQSLIPKWKQAERAAVLADSLNASRLPADTVRAGSLRWLTDANEGTLVSEAVTRSAKALTSFFGTEANVLATHLFVARFRPFGGKDTTRKVIDLAEVFPGRLDIFDRVNDNESPNVVIERILKRSGQIIVGADSSVIRWLVQPFTPLPATNRVRERMFADLVTAPSQVSSRCLGGDLQRCRDALGLRPTADPLTEWYDAPERRLLVLRMRELLDVGAQHAAYAQCDQRRVYAVCDHILRSIPRYAVPPALPTSSRHHFFRIAIQAGGSGAYERFAAAPSRPLEERIADAARMPIDSAVALWRADVVGARPLSPTLSTLSAWTAIAWGIGIMVIALKAASWR